MGVIRLLDCTLRDGGYVNDWEFGHNNLLSIFERLTDAGVDIIEIGFLDDRRPFDINRSIMPDTASVEKIWGSTSKKPNMVVGMIDYGTCKISNIQPCSESFIDGIRVIFKKHIMKEALEYCAQVKQLGYKDFVRGIVGRLRRGEAIQVVPSVRFSAPFAGNPFTLYRRMRRHNPSPYMFYMNFPQITLFGSSPEVMVSCSEDSLLVAPIAGTRRRGKTDAEDRQLAEELLADPKERAEHVMLVDLGRNDLGRVAKPGAVKVERLMEVERFSHVMHLTSRVSAQLGEDAEGGKFDAIDVLAATFPAGTVSGAPKLRAIEIIASLEKKPRGPYAGCIGWIGLDKDSVNLDMGITIRSMWVKDGRLNWQAGGGIVHDSDPDLEWKEVCNKSAIMRLVLSGENDHVSLDR